MDFLEEHKRELLRVSAAKFNYEDSSGMSCLLIAELDAHNYGSSMS